MAFESQNKLISSFNTDNVRNGLFKYQSKPIVTDLRSVSGGFRNLVSAPDSRAGSIYEDIVNTINNVAKVATQIKTSENEKDELKQSIESGEAYSKSYQKFQEDKEKEATAEGKQRIIDAFREGIYEYSNSLTDRNKKALLTTLHSHLGYEVREQASLMKKENFVTLETAINNTSSILLSNTEHLKTSASDYRAKYKELGFTPEEVDGVMFKSLSNSLLAGINDKNVSREAITTAKLKIKEMLEYMPTAKGSKEYNNAINKIVNIEERIIARDKGVINRAIQLNDAEHFEIYNEALHKNGDISTTEYEQNLLAFNSKQDQLSRTPQNTYARLKEQFNLLGMDDKNYSIEELSSVLSSDDKDKLETIREGEISNALLDPVNGVSILEHFSKVDPKVTTSAFNKFAKAINNEVNSYIGQLKSIKDPTSQDYGDIFSKLTSTLRYSSSLADNPRVSGVTTGKGELHKNLMEMRELNSVINSPYLTQQEKVDYLYRNNVDSTKMPVDKTVKSNTLKEAKKNLVKEYGVAYYNTIAGDLDSFIDSKLASGMPEKVLKDTIEEVFKENKLNKHLAVDRSVFNSLFSKVNSDDLDLATKYFESTDYDELVNTYSEQGITNSLNKGLITPEEYNEQLLNAKEKNTRELAVFKKNYKEMLDKAKKDKVPLRIIEDDSTGLILISDGVNILPTRLNLTDNKTFSYSYRNFVTNNKNTMPTDYRELQLLQ